MSPTSLLTQPAPRVPLPGRARLACEPSPDVVPATATAVHRQGGVKSGIPTSTRRADSPFQSPALTSS